MTEYQKIAGRSLPCRTIVLPLQYTALNAYHYMGLFLELGAELSKKTPKRVYEASVVELIGRVPFPELAALKGKKITLYCPNEDMATFLCDMRDMIQIGQRALQNVGLKNNIIKIRGSSCSPEFYTSNTIAPSQLLKLAYDRNRISNIFYKAVQSMGLSENPEKIAQDILSVNELISVPFMISDFLQFSIYQAFATKDMPTILKNIYQMIFGIAGYAAEGIYFRELCPEHFRMNANHQIRLLVPSYFSINTTKENRYAYFLKQVIPEYLPNAANWFLKNRQQPKVLQYFELFPAGVCIGMLERVLRRIFLPDYMAHKCDSLSLTFSDRFEKMMNTHFQEDVELFGGQIPEVPTPAHFQHYQDSLFALLQQHGHSTELAVKIAETLTKLRQFSQPVIRDNGCSSSLTLGGRPVQVHELPKIIANLFTLDTTTIRSISPTEILEKPNEAIETKRMPISNTVTRRMPQFPRYETKRQFPTQPIATQPIGASPIAISPIAQSSGITPMVSPPVAPSPIIQSPIAQMPPIVPPPVAPIVPPPVASPIVPPPVASQVAMPTMDSSPAETVSLDQSHKPVGLTGSATYSIVPRETQRNPNLAGTERLEKVDRRFRMVTKRIPKVPRTTTLQLPIPDIMTNVANASMTQSKVYVQMVKEVMDFIAKKLDKIQELLQDDPKFEEKFRAGFDVDCKT